MRARTLSRPPMSFERGSSMVELMIAVVLISLTIMGLSQVFQSGQRSEHGDTMMTSASYYAQEKVEQLGSLGWSATELGAGRHPAGTATESVGDKGQWQRFYEVEVLPAPLDNLKSITVTVSWNYLGAKSVTATTYVRR